MKQSTEILMQEQISLSKLFRLAELYYSLGYFLLNGPSRAAESKTWLCFNTLIALICYALLLSVLKQRCLRYKVDDRPHIRLEFDLVIARALN